MYMDMLNELVYSQVKTNGECVLPGFGKLVKAHRKARMGRNPATGEEIVIPAKPATTRVRVTALKKLKDMIN